MLDMYMMYMIDLLVEIQEYIILVAINRTVRCNAL